MTITDAPASYTSVAKSLHWIILALLVVQFAIAWTMPEIGRTTVPSGFIGWHLSTGIAIFAVMIVRLVWRGTHAAPPAPADLPTALAILSRVTHYSLYALLIVLPVLGWANVSSRGWAVKLFGALPLPRLCQRARRSVIRSVTSMRRWRL